ncbi:MAG TPA: hypothetical protein H9862_00580 [Candidatus Akkermansia intestinigallinarum]|uniref:Uncharacterized protein n=1 Tax=Candidatus Akkermansia intestinigallinarum TaxID=2838431 RepID=A0A9D1VA35_9BACT|nr:hypothetical protein [Candidatus Akkermansia intestinigallinarum]
MIATRNFRPLLQTGYCVVSDYDESWIESVLQEAADAAGVRLPFRAEIARAVLLYLEQNCPLPSVPLDFLFSRMRRMLDDVGLSRVALHLRTQTPPVNIDLGSLAHERPLPLFFYTELQHRMEALRRIGVRDYRFTGKRESSLLLGNRRRSCPAQQRELAELDGFLSRVEH